MQILRNEISTYIILQMLIIQKNYIHQQMSCYKLMGGGWHLHLMAKFLLFQETLHYIFWGRYI